VRTAKGPSRKNSCLVRTGRNENSISCLSFSVLNIHRLFKSRSTFSPPCNLFSTSRNPKFSISPPIEAGYTRNYKDKLLCGRRDGDLVGLVDWLLHFTSGDRSALSVKRAQLGSLVMSKLFQADFALRNSEPYDCCDGRSFPPVFVGGQKWVWGTIPWFQPKMNSDT
jgi:hypothetical protein